MNKVKLLLPALLLLLLLAALLLLLLLGFLVAHLKMGFLLVTIHGLAHARQDLPL